MLHDGSEVFRSGCRNNDTSGTAQSNVIFLRVSVARIKVTGKLSHFCPLSPFVSKLGHRSYENAQVHSCCIYHGSDF